MWENAVKRREEIAKKIEIQQRKYDAEYKIFDQEREREVAEYERKCSELKLLNEKYLELVEEGEQLNKDKQMEDKKFIKRA